MIVVNVKQTWPLVQRGMMSAEDATMRDWYDLPETKLEAHADVIVGSYKNVVVSAYDVYRWEDLGAKRTRFYGTPSKKFAHLIGQESPVQWRSGLGRVAIAIPTE